MYGPSGLEAANAALQDCGHGDARSSIELSHFTNEINDFFFKHHCLEAGFARMRLRIDLIDILRVQSLLPRYHETSKGNEK